MRILTGVLGALALLGASAGAVQAQEAPEREFCADRPGLGTPSCTLDAGRVALEVGLFGGSFDDADGFETDAYSAAELLLRFGLNDTLEAQVGFAPYAEVNVRDRASGARDSVSGAGDLAFVLRRNLVNPDGSGFSAAVHGFVSAPTGSDGIGADSWGGGVILPVSVDLGGGWSLGLAPEVDWVGDADGDGHHAAYAMVAGISRGFGDFGLGAELFAGVDDDPDGSTDVQSAEFSGTWTPPTLDDVQFDAGLNVGLNDEAADIGVYAGVAKRF